MAFRLEVFAVARPFVYHLTSADNLVRICEVGSLESASSLITRAKRGELLRQRRPKHTPINVAGREVWLRDQAPLHAANVDFAEGWNLGDLVEALNRLVFFWAGTASGPSDYGQRHFDRYRTEEPVLLRVPTAALFAANQSGQPLFCRYNSGSPRYSGGRASPRGPETFVPPNAFLGSPARVVELAFTERAKLPPSTEYGFAPAGPWQVLL
jgi:hypothetical protein